MNKSKVANQRTHISRLTAGDKNTRLIAAPLPRSQNIKPPQITTKLIRPRIFSLQPREPYQTPELSDRTGRKQVLIAG